VTSAVNNTTAAIHLHLDAGYCVLNALYGAMRSALVQEAVKVAFVEHACKEELRYRV
jgi:hypothetical protein